MIEKHLIFTSQEHPKMLTHHQFIYATVKTSTMLRLARSASIKGIWI